MRLFFIENLPTVLGDQHSFLPEAEHVCPQRQPRPVQKILDYVLSVTGREEVKIP